MAALDDAIEALTERWGAAPDGWRWAEANDVWFPHRPFDSVRGLRRGFSRSTLAAGDDFTIVATAVAPDRVSYGCAMGKEQTEFGRTVFADHLKSDPTIVGALRAAIADIELREQKEGLTLSRPQLSVGSAIAPKLAELEDRARGRSFRVH